MDYRTAIATYIIILLLYIVIRRRNPDANWGSSAQSLTFLSALKSVQSLEKVDDHVKNYRPKVRHHYLALIVCLPIDGVASVSIFPKWITQFLVSGLQPYAKKERTEPFECCNFLLLLVTGIKPGWPAQQASALSIAPVPLSKN